MNSNDLKYLQAIPGHAKDIILRAEGDDLIDVLAEVNSVERMLGQIRRGHQTELVDEDEGSEWAVKTSRSAQRTYNTPSLVVKASEVLNVSPLRAIAELKERGILSINWKWTQLKDFLIEHDLEYVTVSHEIEDEDNADIGEVWTTSSVRYVKK